MAGGEQGTGGGGRQTFIVLLLVGALILLHRFAVPTGQLDPTGMLALGFVILASYTIGKLVDVIKLPHITGYLLAGIIFGPSVAALLPEATLPPFDRGVLNDDVIRQLSVLDTLAVALIAMTAGGELKLEGLRRGIKTILGVLGGQLLTIGVAITAFIWAVSGAFPAISMPGLDDVPGSAVLALGATVAAISFATSPAATIAVITDTGSRGPMSRTVLSAVVLKDVIVVVAFSIASTWAATQLGTSVSDQPLATFLLVHIGVSLLVGVVIGGGFALYLRYVGREILLVIVGVVYAATLLARSLDLDPVLVFIAAGFTTSNFSRDGDTLIHNVERLSMPVYVVFFTLAGAKLHLEQVVDAAPFALTLVALRAGALHLGVGAGARLGGDENLRKYGWLGFVSQAGVALSLATIVGQRLGEPGRALETLIIAGIAVNELVGPVLLKVGLGLAGETEEAGKEEEEERPRTTSIPPGGKRVEVEPWPEAQAAPDAWGAPLASGSDRLNREIRELQVDLQALVRDVRRGPLERYRSEAGAYLRDLRREYLRHHRRLLVAARGAADAGNMGELLHSEQTELAERWRGILLGRAARVGQRAWTPDQLVESVDRVVQTLPEKVEAPFEPESFLKPESQSPLRAIRRTGLRWRRWLRAVTGREMSNRTVELRQLARYHLSGRAPAELEALAALLVQADTHLAARTRSLFDGITEAYDRIADEETDDQERLETDLRTMRVEVESELSLAVEEIERIVAEGTARTERVLGGALSQVKDEVSIAGTLDLSNRARRSSKIFRGRVRALQILTDKLGKIRESLSGTYSLVALELELIGLEARIKDALAEHARELEKDVRGRSLVQAERVVHALMEARSHIGHVLATGEHTGEQLAASLRQLTEPLDKVAGEAARASIQLRDQLTDERVVAPLLDALSRAAAGLTDRYQVPTAMLRHGEWRLPQPVPTTEVPFRELVTAHIEAEVAPELVAVTRAMAHRVTPFSTSLVELERLVAFNIELASGELDIVHDETVPEETRQLLREMLLGGLERNTEVVRGHVEEAESWPGELGAEIRDAVLGGIESLRGQLVEGQVSQLRVELMRRRAAGRRLMRRAGRVRGVFGRFRERLRRTSSSLIGEERIEAWRHGLGLPARVDEEAPGPVAFAPPRAADHLPLVYRRLFASETIEAGDVLTGRDAQIEQARRVLSGEAPGTLRAVALVGQDGVGKGALSSAIVRSRPWKNVRRIVLEEQVTLEQVEGWFEKKHENHLVVISGFHWLVAMRPGGFNALRRFVQGVIEDAGKNAWLLHADQLVWEYATQAAPLAEAFPEVVQLDVLDPAELEAAVLARHGLSGYGINFEPHVAKSQMDSLFVRGAGRIRRPYESYFRDLHQASGGLVRDALRLWLASIEEVSEKQDFVHVGPVPPSAQRAIRRLPENVLLEIYQIARQGWMDAKVQAHLFRVDEPTAEAQLSRLAHMGLLEKKPSGAYRIPSHLRGPVYRVLQEQGWIE